ncbi:MAG: hypothetical protein KHY88_02010 [Erysipelotrichaceae bacterium]|nr:hypothetical protein [Erysipelotrichaceae bacterium]
MKSIIIKKTFEKLIIVACASIFWDFAIKSSPLQTMINYPIIFFAFLFLGFAWFNYLKLDGLRLPTNYNKIKKAPKHKAKQMIDYVETEVKNDQHLTKNQLLYCKLYSNLICAVVLLIPVIITYLI